MSLSLRNCTLEDIDTLRELSIKTYYDTFVSMCAPSDMTAYLAKTYDRSKLLRELCNEHERFFFLLADEKVAGYLKLNEAPSQSDINDERSLEIERIYVSAAFQGKGFGKFLMEQAVHKAVELGKQYVWLGVWERNKKALRFYRNNGFYAIGTHSFIMGDDKQTDYIMRRDLTTSSLSEKEEWKCAQAINTTK